jgi:hypothetical protein
MQPKIELLKYITLKALHIPYAMITDLQVQPKVDPSSGALERIGQWLIAIKL